ncbi:hypothetical protein [Oleiphilus messinensis]|uniref:hypothetical protein n=1 Tax=Oleiphilus messinensis TaxID=141451 RepID=UPI0012F8956E|nr:hypothetical protein [Oleiphilus messinensis]
MGQHNTSHHATMGAAANHMIKAGYCSRVHSAMPGAKAASQASERHRFKDIVVARERATFQALSRLPSVAHKYQNAAALKPKEDNTKINPFIL